MLTLLATTIFAIIIAFFALQNAVPVRLTVGDNALNDVPLYLVVIGALMLGIFLSWIINLIDSFSASLTARNREQTIDKDQKVISELEDRIHELEVENARLKGNEHIMHPEPMTIEKPTYRPSLFDRLRHSFR
jgi:uncharacterized integral membrane protein